MKILFEEYQYQTEEVKDILGSFILNGLDLTKPTQQMRYVGYFFNKDITNHDGSKGDLVFILPKVLLDADGKAFGLDPKQIINFNFKDWKNDEKVTPEGKLTKLQVYNFIYGFATWIYRAVDIYRKSLRNKSKQEDDDTDVEVMTSVQVGQSGKKENVTFMDVLLSLLDFQRTHRNFITFVIKMAHSGFNKVSWPKTIARTQAVVQNGSPIYLNPINKERVVNFDEELLIIYYSILDYMHEEYGFPIPNQPGYKLIKGAMFRSYMKSQGKTRLHKIRYKYYSDDAILLWNLCYAFFDVADNIKGQANRKDYLLINKFETVFEGMIDELIGDKDLPTHLKNQADDKRIDHLYTYKYLLENLDGRNDKVMSSDIYNIADSKYYRRDKGLKGHDVPKQFTYVRNVIQWHMDLLNGIIEGADDYREIPLFDKTTEGFNIIPNFFISGKVNDELSYDTDNMALSTIGEGKNVHESFFFWDRLFDRNTFFTLHYDVNFLYILKMYAQNKSYNKAIWKEIVRNKFRKEMLSYLNEEFDFYQVMIASSDIKDFVDTHYRKLAGRVFSFKPCGKEAVLLYAERKKDKDGKNRTFTDEEVHVKTQNSLFISKSEQCYPVRIMQIGVSEYEEVHPKVKYELKLENTYSSAAENDDYQVYISNKQALTTEKKYSLDAVEEKDKYVRYLPLYDIKIACGALEEEGVQSLSGSNANIMCWLDTSNLGFKVTKNMFIVEAKGESMLPEIYPGDLCVFELYGEDFVGSRDGYIVLVKAPSQDKDYLCRYTIKKYHSEKKQYPDGTWEHTKIELIPLNKEYEIIQVNPEDADFRVLAIYKGKL